MEVIKLPEQTAASTGYNYKVVITHADLTETTAATAQTLSPISVGVGAIVRDAAIYLKTDFQDASDSAFNTTTVTVGETDVDRFVASTELNVNGTEVDAAGGVAANMPYAFTAADTIDVIFTPMSGKALNDIDAGELWVFLSVVELSDN